MINGKKVLAYIPARSGSKSIIDKNIIEICGKPLIAYSILAAKGSKYVDKVIISTDSAKYAEIAKEYGAEAPFLRPPELAQDTSVEMDSCQHMLKWVEDNWSEKFDIVLKLEPTSPLRLPEDLDKAIEQLSEKNADSVVSVTEAVTHPWWMNTLPENHSMTDFIRPEARKKNRQQLPVYYQIDGVVYAATWDHLKAKKWWLSENNGFASITPRERSIDIDSPIELELVKILIKQREDQKMKSGDNKSNIEEQKSIITSQDDTINETLRTLFSLKGKVIIITGGAGLLGQQHAEVLSNAGANIVIADINQKMCDSVAERISIESGFEALGIAVDITNEISIQCLVERVKEKYGKIDILINNAVAKVKNSRIFEECELDTWNKCLNVNLTGVFLCSKIIGCEMIKLGKGSIINIGSIYGLVGPDQSIYGDSGINSSAVYSASKSGVIGLTKYLATYWGNKGIRVNCLTLGGVENGQDQEFINKYSAKTPLGRMAKKEDYKGALLFLASEASAYMTGANLVIDGGWTAW